ncbi:MAG: hypothetical protein AAF621_07455 [Pseudomonadota bacterium]
MSETVVTFDLNDHVDYSALSRSSQKEDTASYLLMKKASVYFRYDELQHALLDCGMSPVFVKLSDDDKDDILSPWRIKLSLMKMVNGLSKISANERMSDLLVQFEKTAHEIMQYLAHDFVQIGREFLEKLGCPEHHAYLQERLEGHIQSIDSFEERLKNFRNILSTLPQ